LGRVHRTKNFERWKGRRWRTDSRDFLSNNNVRDCRSTVTTFVGGDEENLSQRTALNRTSSIVARAPGHLPTKNRQSASGILWKNVNPDCTLHQGESSNLGFHRRVPTTSRSAPRSVGRPSTQSSTLSSSSDVWRAQRRLKIVREPGAPFSTQKRR
jgi:hypothetical protein